MITSRLGHVPLLAALTFTALGSSGAFAQINLAPAPGGIPAGNVVCAASGDLAVSDNNGDCDTGALVTTMTFESGSSLIVDSGATATFNGTADFTNNVQMSGLQAFSGTSAFNSTVTFTGPSVTFSTGTTFQNPATFNSTADFNGAMTTTSINNSGTISSTNVNAGTVLGGLVIGFDVVAVDLLAVENGATVNMGDNVVHGVAAGVADTDAVNVGQLNAATAGISADVSALEATTAFHTTQIAEHTTQISELQTTTATHTSQITAIEAVNTTHTSQITAIEAVNATQSGQISALEAAQSSMAADIDTLFDLRSSDRRDMKQGVAAAMSMASPPMPSEPGRISYAVNGATFRGEYAVGGSLMYRLPTRAPMAVNVGFSYAGNKNNGVRVGVAGEF